MLFRADNEKIKKKFFFGCVEEKNSTVNSRKARKKSFQSECHFDRKCDAITSINPSIYSSVMARC